MPQQHASQPDVLREIAEIHIALGQPAQAVETLCRPRGTTVPLEGREREMLRTRFDATSEFDDLREIDNFQQVVMSLRHQPLSN